jgi:hypothetical protein
VKEVIEQKFSQIDGVTDSVEDNWEKVKETPLDNLNNDIGKMEIAPRKQWITEVMIKKMEERRIAKTTNIREYRRLNNQLTIEADRAKEVYMEVYMRGNNGSSKERQV